MPKRETPFGWTLADEVVEPKNLPDVEAKKAVALLYDQVRAGACGQGTGRFCGRNYRRR